MKKRLTRIRPWLTLGALYILAFSLMTFSNGRWVLPIAAWLGPMLLVRFLMRTPVFWGLLLGYPLFLGSAAIQWWHAGQVPSGYLLYAGVCAAAVLFYLPFVIHRWIGPKIHGFWSTLVLPLAWVSCEFIFSFIFADFGSIAYSQARNLPLLQLVSLTGTFGITFLIGWFAAVANWAWEKEFRWLEVRRGILGFLIILLSTHLAGSARMMLFPPASTTARVASITVDPGEVEALMRQFTAAGGRFNDYDTQQAVNKMRTLNELLLEKTRREARAGARFVLWSESSGYLLKQEEWSFFKKAQELTRKEGIYLFAAVTTFIPDQTKVENKVIGFGPHGETLFEYFKSHLSPGENSILGAGRLPSVETASGKLTTAICADLDYHRYLRQAGLMDADTLLDASWEWPEINPIHTWIAITRAVENGFNLVKQTRGGQSVVADYQGRVLGELDYYRSRDHVLVSQIPTAGVPTLYDRIGDSFAWLCLMGLVLVIGIATAPPLKLPSSGRRRRKS